MNRVDAINRGMTDIQPLEAVEIPPMQDKVTDEEWKIRVDLAAAYRLIAYYGWDDLIFTHLSARIPGPEHHFLLNPYNLMFEEVTASSLIKVDMNGLPVEPTPFITNPAGFTIHSAIHMAREDAQAVIHLHTPHGQAVSAHGDGLLPLTQTAMLIRDEIAYHDYEGVAVDLDERERIVEDLGPHDAMIMRNHGLLTCGPTVQQAFNTMYQLELACRSQVDVMAARVELCLPPQEVLEHTAYLYQPGTRRPYGVLEWPAMLRLLAAEPSGYPPYWH
jgi:ribulose-5-phosphate 4-epimerase/fuculose-1-phosphate aldolase